MSQGSRLQTVQDETSEPFNDAVERMRGSKWPSALPTGSRRQSALPTSKEVSKVKWNKRSWILLAAGCGAVLCVIAFRRQVSLLFRLLLSGGALAFVLCPVSEWFCRTLHVPRGAGLALAFAAAGLVLALVIWLLIPPLAGQLRQLIAGFPALARQLRGEGERLLNFLRAHGINLPLELPDFPWEQAMGTLTPLLSGTASFAGSVATVVTEITLALTLSYYLIRDRERLFLQLELLAPSAYRRLAVRMAHAVRHELNTYLRGQALISLAVGALAALGLMVIGLPGFLVLGLIVGVMNMIPYFGPVLGGIPAVLMALTQGGLRQALFTAALLFGVQQVDNLLISPRLMGSVTGLHPAVVLLAITLGGSLSGLGGMLLAIPCVLVARSLLRTQAASVPVNGADNRTQY